jgi:hypothetical protein
VPSCFLPLTLPLAMPSAVILSWPQKATL